jgi:hypothetical protein
MNPIHSWPAVATRMTRKTPSVIGLAIFVKVKAYLKRTNYKQVSRQIVKRRVFRNASHVDTILWKSRLPLLSKSLLLGKQNSEHTILC